MKIRCIWLLISLFAIFMTSCGQTGLFDLSKNGVPLVYAVSYDGTNANLLIAGGDDYIEQHPIGIFTPAVGDVIHAASGGNIFLAHAGTMYTNNLDHIEDPWITQVTGLTLLDIASSPDQTLLLNSITSNCLYRFDESTKTWIALSPSRNSTGTPEKLCYDPNNGAFFVSTNAGGNIDIYVLTDVSDMPFFLMVPVQPTRRLFTCFDNKIYSAGDNGTSYWVYENAAQVLSGTPGGYQSFAVESGPVIYAAGLIGTLGLYREEGGVLVQKYAFTSASGTINIASMGSGIIAVGISGSLVDDGLYTYDFKKGRLKKFSSESVYALFVR